MIEMLVVGLITAIACIVVMAKINLLRFLWIEVIVDVMFTGALLFMFAGTLGGMIAAVFAGLVLSIALWLLKKRLGYERLRMRKGRVHWERVHNEGKS
jgi:ascorbate-specific PTS system EIIC-type component UlaA